MLAFNMPFNPFDGKVMQLNQHDEPRQARTPFATHLPGESVDQSGLLPLSLNETAAAAIQVPSDLRQDSVPEYTEIAEIAGEDVSSLALNLETSNTMLQCRVDDLTRELASIRAERQQELVEKESIAHRLTALLDALPGGVLVLDRSLIHI